MSIAFTVAGQAISMQELQSSPQFKVIHESRLDMPGADERTTWYLDTGTLEVLEYAPPVYKIKSRCRR